MLYCSLALFPSSVATLKYQKYFIATGLTQQNYTVNQGLHYMVLYQVLAGGRTVVTALADMSMVNIRK